MTTWVDAVGWALIHFVWQGAVLAMATATILYVCRSRSANARYLVACIGLALMVVAPVMTAGILWSPADERVASGFATHSSLAEPTAVALLGRGDSVLLAGESTRGWMDPLLPYVVVIWLGGVVLLGTRLTGGLWRIRHLRRTALAEPVSPWQAVADRVATQLRLPSAVRVVESRLVDTPTAVGWITPVVLLPVAALANLTPGQVEAILAHELAHIRRHDYVVNVLQTLAETLLFYHPAVWWVSRRIRTEREHCCDDLAVTVCNNRITYAAALAELETERARETRLALAATRGPLIDRIRRVLQVPTEHESRSLSGAVSLAISVVVVLGASGVLPFTIPGDDEPRMVASAQQTEPLASPDTFDWQVETTEHFELIYYPALQPELEGVGTAAEQAYAQVSEVLDHQLGFLVPLILFKTREDFNQQDIAEIPEAVLQDVTSFSEPRRDRIVILLDEDPNRWYVQVAHELTHIFQFDIVSGELASGTRRVPMWMLEGMANYATGAWEAEGLAHVQEIVSDGNVPRLPALGEADGTVSGGTGVNLGHVAFDFIEAEYGADRIKDFLMELRRYVLEGSEEFYETTLQLTPDEFDEAFAGYLRERFGAPRQGGAHRCVTDDLRYAIGAYVEGDTENYRCVSLLGYNGVPAGVAWVPVDKETLAVKRPFGGGGGLCTLPEDLLYSQGGGVEFRGSHYLCASVRGVNLDLLGAMWIEIEFGDVLDGGVLEMPVAARSRGTTGDYAA